MGLSVPQISPHRALESCILSQNVEVQRANVGTPMTLTMIILLAWLPLSVLLGMLVGGCIRFGSGEPSPRPVLRQDAGPKRQKFFPAGASV